MSNIRDRHTDMLHKLSRTYFRPRNIWQKHLIRDNQRNEYTRIHERRREGRCYNCEKTDFVAPHILWTCFDCANKRGLHSILAIVAFQYQGYCDFHGAYVKRFRNRRNLAQINVRLCASCFDLALRNTRKHKRLGMENLDPYHKFLMHKFGHDYPILSQMPSSVRK